MSLIDALLWEKTGKVWKKMVVPLNTEFPLNPLNSYLTQVPSGALPKHSFGMISISSLAKIASL